MDEKLREKLVLAIERSARMAGANDYEEGMESARNLITWVYDRIQSIRTLDDLRAVLDSCPPFSRREEAILLFLVNQMPQVIRFGLKVAAKKATSTLPAPKGGRPLAIPASEAREVLDYILLLYRKGCTFEVAKNRAAQKFGCHLRTVERLWSRRALIGDEDQPIEVKIDDVLEYLSTKERTAD